MGTVIPEFGSLNPAFACAEDYRIVVAGSHSAIGGKTRLMILIHIWSAPDTGTAGCIGLPEEPEHCRTFPARLSIL
jgi:hypothetical protein